MKVHHVYLKQFPKFKQYFLEIFCKQICRNKLAYHSKYMKMGLINNDHNSTFKMMISFNKLYLYFEYFRIASNKINLCRPKLETLPYIEFMSTFMSGSVKLRYFSIDY